MRKVSIQMMNNLLLFNRNQFSKLKENFKSESKELLTITHYLDAESIADLNENIVMDISSLAALLSSNDNVQFQFEQLIKLFPDDTVFIADEKYRKEIEFSFRYCFDEIQMPNIEYDELLSDENSKSDRLVTHKVKRIIDLSDDDLTDFFANFNNRLYGHSNFKSDFQKKVDSFRVFNMIGEHKILSLFLMGDSGVGKTEVARAIHKALGSKHKLAKINFGNYSSHDALNSLIGSPLGYIGSDGGELRKRILESDVGVILIDEFEKADSAVFNYFLDVLENGKITNTNAEEHDVSGYIIVFTSNITEQEFKKRISPELRSRFDYVGMFNLLTNEDKEKFVKYRFSEIIEKYELYAGIKLSQSTHSELVSQVNVEKFTNMRHLNKKIKDTFVKYIREVI